MTVQRQKTAKPPPLGNGHILDCEIRGAGEDVREERRCEQELVPFESRRRVIEGKCQHTKHYRAGGGGIWSGYWGNPVVFQEDCSVERIQVERT